MNNNPEEDITMEAKAYLNQARLLDQRISAKLDRVARLRALTEKVTATLGPERRGDRNVTFLQDQIIRLMEAEDELNADIDRLVELKKEISDVISRIGDPDSHFSRSCAICASGTGMRSPRCWVSCPYRPEYARPCSAGAGRHHENGRIQNQA